MRSGIFFMLMLMLAGRAAAQSIQAKADSCSAPARKPSLFTAPKPAGYLILSPANNYNQHFGFMCKQEWKLEKKTNIPVRLRLGSLEHTNRLEGKH